MSCWFLMYFVTSVDFYNRQYDITQSLLFIKFITSNGLHFYFLSQGLPRLNLNRSKEKKQE